MKTCSHILFVPVIYHTSKEFCTCVGACAYDRTPLLKRAGRACFISNIFFYLIKIKMLSCLCHTAHACLFDTRYISYYLHLLLRFNRLRFTMEWPLLEIWSFTRKTRLVSHTLLSPIITSQKIKTRDVKTIVKYEINDFVFFFQRVRLF